MSPQVTRRQKTVRSTEGDPPKETETHIQGEVESTNLKLPDVIDGHGPSSVELGSAKVGPVDRARRPPSFVASESMAREYLCSRSDSKPKCAVGYLRHTYLMHGASVLLDPLFKASGTVHRV